MTVLNTLILDDLNMREEYDGYDEQFFKRAELVKDLILYYLIHFFFLLDPMINVFPGWLIPSQSDRSIN